jgi:endo-1,4-beta-D-glucanase Y
MRASLAWLFGLLAASTGCGQSSTDVQSGAQGGTPVRDAAGDRLGSGGGPAGNSGGAANNSGGAAGTSGTAGTSGSPVVTDAAGAGGAARDSGTGTVGVDGGGRFSFPQNQRSARCTYPAGASAADAQRAYERWKSELVVSSGAGGHLRVRRPNSPGAEVDSTVSEGIGYGMILAVVMDDPALFDELWKYSQAWLDSSGLMNWYINAAGTTPLGAGAATDGDEDMAFALVMAARQWGGSGTLGEAYLDVARRQIDLIWQHEVDHANADLLLPGDTWAGNVIFNPSYFAPNQYRIFGAVTGNVDGWTRVIDTGYAVLARSTNAANGNQNTGLTPAWCGADGNVRAPFAGGATNYQYDSARVPFRIGQDYCVSGEPRAAAYLARISAFFSGIGAANIVDGYDLGGMPHPDPGTPPGSPQSAVFLGGAAIGAMHDGAFSALVNDAYARVATGELLARSRYYNLSWTALSLLMLTGNLVEYPP